MCLCMCACCYPAYSERQVYAKSSYCRHTYQGGRKVNTSLFVFLFTKQYFSRTAHACIDTELCRFLRTGVYLYESLLGVGILLVQEIPPRLARLLQFNIGYRWYNMMPRLTRLLL